MLVLLGRNPRSSARIVLLNALMHVKTDTLHFMTAYVILGQVELPNANQRSSQEKKKPTRQSRYTEMKMICALRLSSLEE